MLLSKVLTKRLCGVPLKLCDHRENTHRKTPAKACFQWHTEPSPALVQSPSTQRKDHVIVVFSKWCVHLNYPVASSLWKLHCYFNEATTVPDICKKSFQNIFVGQSAGHIMRSQVHFSYLPRLANQKLRYPACLCSLSVHWVLRLLFSSSLSRPPIHCLVMKSYGLYEHADIREGRPRRPPTCHLLNKTTLGRVQPPKAIRGTLLSLKCNYRRLLRNSFAQIYKDNWVVILNEMGWHFWKHL